ncbi:MAG: aminoglycoside phosphotransferase [Gammaproteobacteria bacterium]|nr:MAG: aminoglycoside phosphotransferase [Gammaproteobacteria bacterium]
MSRLNSIHNWLKTVLKTESYQLEPASADASFRRYFRVSLNNETWVLMDAPPEKEDTQPFIRIAEFLNEHHVHVPEIKAHDANLGFLLLSDFGKLPYLGQLSNSSVDKYYALAINSIIDMQLCPTDALNLPSYDRNLLQQELSLFSDWFLDKHLGLTAPDFLQGTFELLIENALEQPQVFVHRDYHSRNLMHTATRSPGIIDFQDAVLGPISYDLVSLLRDCYISWPEDKIAQWISDYLIQAQARGLLTNISLTQFTRWFDLMGLQRHIKVLGIFCRLNYRDGKANYIDDLPLTLHYVKQVSSRYPELAQLNQFLNQYIKIEKI